MDIWNALHDTYFMQGVLHCKNLRLFAGITSFQFFFCNFSRGQAGHFVYFIIDTGNFKQGQVLLEIFFQSPLIDGSARFYRIIAAADMPPELVRNPMTAASLI
jgi:hypothetical protein